MPRRWQISASMAFSGAAEPLIFIGRGQTVDFQNAGMAIIAFEYNALGQCGGDRLRYWRRRIRSATMRPSSAAE